MVLVFLAITTVEEETTASITIENYEAKAVSKKHLQVKVINVSRQTEDRKKRKKSIKKMKLHSSSR